MSQLPLQGIRVVELARILAGPWAGQTLADLGADVIKVESPSGDDTRKWGPPFIETQGQLNAAYYHSCNRGKKSVVIDFATDQGLQELKNLIADADVLIENFKVGSLAKYGLDYETLKQDYPRLIYCSITGFGQNGPYSKRSGYDFLMQGMSGLMSITGEPDKQPQKVGVAVTDIFTGLYAVIAIQAALTMRQITDKGQQIDLALLDVATAITANQAMNFLVTGDAPGRRGNDHPNIVPYCVVESSDGYVILAVGNDRQFQSFCQIFSDQNWGNDPRFSTNALRIKNRETLLKLIEDQTRTMTKADLLAACEKHVVPAGPINTIEEVFHNPQIIHRRMCQIVDGVPTVRNPIFFSDINLDPHHASPNLDHKEPR